MSELVKLMMRAGVLTPQQAQEARAQQVVYGDRIGTNLVDMGFVDETLLAQALGSLHQVPYAAGSAADTTPTVARAIPASAAGRLNAVPARWDGQVMHVFVMDPRNSRVVGELEQILHRRVSPVVVVEARMWEMLRKHYNVRRGLRALALDGDPMARAQQLLKQAAAKTKAAGPSGQQLGELSSEEEFNAIYQTAPSGGMTSTERAVAMAEAAAARHAQEHAPPPPEELPAVAMGTLIPPPPAVVVDGIPVVDEPPPPPPPLPPPPPIVTPQAAALAAASALPQPAAWEPAPSADWGAHVDAAKDVEPTDAISLEIEFDDPPVEKPDVSPLGFSQAREMLAGVEDRNAIARVVLRYAITPFKRAVLLTVQKDLAIGWDALGEGLDQDVAERVILPLQQPSIFRLARESRAHFMGPVPRGAANFLFLKLIGGKVPRSAFVIPVVVHGKVVNLLYCDNGGGQESTTDVGELLILAQHINRSYEALLKKAA
jgi:hypothetical protein